MPKKKLFSKDNSYEDNIRQSVYVLKDIYKNTDSKIVHAALDYAINALYCRLPVNTVDYETINKHKLVACKNCGRLMILPEPGEEEKNEICNNSN